MERLGKRLFDNEQNLYLLLNFRLQGYSLGALSQLFRCDKMTVKLKCDRYGIHPLEFSTKELSTSKINSFSLSRVVSVVLDEEPKEPRWRMVDGEKLNTGRSYKDYLHSTLSKPRTVHN